MIQTTAMLIESLSEYSDPFGKIKRMCSEGKIHQLVKGIYETDSSVSGYLLAPVIYGPSYLSFDYALSRHGLIPEAVTEYTSATCGKGKKKLHHNRFGHYSYRDVPNSAFPFETELLEENGYFYSLATPEKALCDKLYTISPIKNHGELTQLLFSNLRIDEAEFMRLDPKKIEELSRVYRSSNVAKLASLIRRMHA